LFNNKVVFGAIILGLIVGSVASYLLFSSQNNSQINSLQNQLGALTTQVNSLKSEKDTIKINLTTSQKSLDEAKVVISLLTSRFMPRDDDFLNYTLTSPLFMDFTKNTLYTFAKTNVDDLVNITSSNALGISGGLFLPQWYIVDVNTRTVMDTSVNLESSIGKPLMIWLQPSLRDIKVGSVVSLGSLKPPFLIASSRENITVAGRSFTAWKAEYKVNSQPHTIAWWGVGSNQSSSFSVGDWQQNIGVYSYEGNVTVELYREKTNELVSRVEPKIIGWNPNIFAIYEPGSYYLKVIADPGVNWHMEFSRNNINLMGYGSGNSRIFRINGTKWNYQTGISANASVKIYRAVTNELVWSGSGWSEMVTLPGPGSFYVKIDIDSNNVGWGADIMPPMDPPVESEHYTAWYDSSTGLMLRFTAYMLPDRQFLGGSTDQQLILAYELKNSNIFTP
jgi:hypothetical protein